MRTWLIRGALTVVALAVLATCTGVGTLMMRPAESLRSLQAMGIDGAFGAPTPVPSSSGPVQVWSAGSGPAVLLVHGFGDAGAGWTQVAQDLAADHQVWVMDLPGHGRSEPAGRAPTFDEMLAGVDAVITHIDAPVLLVGNSLGGWLAGAYSLEHPDALRGVVFVNAAGLEQALDPALLMPEDRDALVRKNKAVMGEHAPSLPGFLADGMVEISSSPRLKTLFAHLTDEAPKLDERIAGVSVPAGFIWGTPDPFFPAQGYLERYQAALPQASTTLLDGCAHAPQYSCPTETASAIRTLSAAAD